MNLIWLPMVVKQCLSLQPSHPQALTNLGNIYMEWYVMLNAWCFSESFNFLVSSMLMISGFFQTWRNMLPAAASYYKATLAVTTGLSAPFNNLAVIYKQQVVVCFWVIAIFLFRYFFNFLGSFYFSIVQLEVLVVFLYVVLILSAFCYHDREIMQMLYLATMKFFALIPWLLMGWSIGVTLTRRLVEWLMQSRTIYVLSPSAQLWPRPMQIWLLPIKTGIVILLRFYCSF